MALSVLAHVRQAPEKVVARPNLVRRLDGAAHIVVLSAPAGSGKTVLLRSWRSEAATAWVSVNAGERDPVRFWLSVLKALRATRAGAALVKGITAAPELDGWAIVERLLSDLSSLHEELVLIVDDLHELLSPDGLQQLELLVMRAPATLRFVLAGREELRLGLHRLRLEDELTEIRASDLRFTQSEASALFAAAGLDLSTTALAALHQRTEGWAAGLRLAALSMSGHPEPERFAKEFSGNDRTVAEFLLREVLEHQTEIVRRVLLRTSVLDRVNGPLADLLAGTRGGERILQDLERANAFVVSDDAARTWFRYHQMFAELLALELRRTEPDEIAGLHRTAAGWFAAHGDALEAIRHAQAAEDWELAARWLADAAPGLHLDGQRAVIHQLLTAFPAHVLTVDAELAAVMAADELTVGTLEDAERFLAIAEARAQHVPAGRRESLTLSIGINRLLAASQRGDALAAREKVQELQVLADAPGVTRRGLDDERRALALISLGLAEIGTGLFMEATRHLEHGVTLARRIGRPYLEFTGLAYLASQGISSRRAIDQSRRSLALAGQHGWTDDPTAGFASAMLAEALRWQGRFDEADGLLRHAARTSRADTGPIAGAGVSFIRGLIGLATGRPAEALSSFATAARLTRLLSAPSTLDMPNIALTAHALVLTGEPERADKLLAAQQPEARDRGEIRIARAAIRLASRDARGASELLAPVLSGEAALIWPIWLAHAEVAEAIARQIAGEPERARGAVARALAIAESDCLVGVGRLFPHWDVIDTQPNAPGGAVHGMRAVPDGPSAGRPIADTMPSSGGPEPLREPLRESELRVLRYLATNLTGPEIGQELYISRNTIKTHLRNLYEKLGVHTRTQAVDRARELDLLAPRAYP